MADTDAYDVKFAFEAIEDELIRSMMRNMAGHRNWELDEGFEWTMWQAEQLKALNRFRLNNYERYGPQFASIKEQIEHTIRQAYTQGSMDQEIEILKAIRDGFQPDYEAIRGLGQDFFIGNERKLDALVQSVTSDMDRAEISTLRMPEDQYRKIIYNAQVYANTGAGALWSAVDMAAKQFLTAGINSIEYKNGNRVNIASYSEMAIRTANKRAYLMGEGDKRQEWGIALVKVHGRSVACPRCLQWIGRIYVDDVWSGGVPDGKHLLLSSAIAGGLYHPNCRDIHSTYFEGVSEPPEPLTQEQANEASRVYELQQKQRYNERQIRRFKRLSEGSLDPDNVAKYQYKLKEWQKTQRELISANPELRRNPARENTRGLKQGTITYAKPRKAFVGSGDERDLFAHDSLAYGGLSFAVLPENAPDGFSNIDLLMGRDLWEIKSPNGNSVRCIESNLRKAKRQFKNQYQIEYSGTRVIFNGRYCGIDDDQISKEIARQMEEHEIEKVIQVLKDGGLKYFK